MEVDQNQSLYEYEPDYIDPNHIKPFPTAARWGLYGGLASIALGLVLYLFGITDYAKRGGGMLPQITSYIIWIGAIAMAIRAHKMEDLGGFISFKRGVGTGALTGVVFAVFVGVWSYIFFSFIAPDALDLIREASYNQMLDRGMSEEEIEAAAGMMDNFTSPAFISLTAFFSTAIISVVISLIAAAIMKRDLPHTV